MIENRDHARVLIASHGINHRTVTQNQLKLLHSCIDQRMQASGNYKGTYRMTGGVSHFMACCTDQWEFREAVSFNRDGFVGFAGWADNSNVRPILDGVEEWLHITRRLAENGIDINELEEER